MEQRPDIIIGFGVNFLYIYFIAFGGVARKRYQKQSF
ncbi:hypothetical protein MARHY1651 [Marinobacter nauticus ATCC 49840]|nr:hypothetical protein MARHY1651 [Marinobacter nauticus ATCC 49840]